MADKTDPSSYSKAEPALLREIIAAAEVRLESQLTASLAADQRALVLAGFLVPTIAGLVGAAAALLLQNPPLVFLGRAALWVAVGLLLSLFLTIFAARPVGWMFPGARPAAWIADIASQKSEVDRLAELAADAEDKAGQNARLMAQNGWIVTAALLVAAASLAAGGLAVVCTVSN